MEEKRKIPIKVFDNNNKAFEMIFGIWQYGMAPFFNMHIVRKSPKRTFFSKHVSKQIL